MSQHPQRFTRAIDALVKGYLNNTLAKGTCHGCAVGNIVAASCGYQIAPTGDKCFLKNGIPLIALRGLVFSTDHFGQHINRGEYQGEAKRQIDATGYSWLELAIVEEAFELHTSIHFAHYAYRTLEEIDADQYRGLMAVVGVLCEIEGIADAEPIRQQFAKVAA